MATATDRTPNDDEFAALIGGTALGSDNTVEAQDDAAGVSNVISNRPPDTREGDLAAARRLGIASPYSSVDDRIEDPLNEEQQQEHADQQQSVAPKHDDSKFQYWQSQAQRAQHEIEQMKREFEALQTVKPIAEYIQNDPEILSLIEQRVSGQAPSNGISNGRVAPGTVVPDRPTKPERPANYDPQDAIMVPESPSYQYREAMGEYQTNLIEWQAAQLEAQQARARQQAEQQRLSQIEQQRIRSIHDHVVSNYGMTAEDADSFMQFASSDDQYTLDNLVKLWQLTRTGEKVGEQERARRAQELQSRQTRLTTPQSTAGVGSGAERTMSDDEAFNRSMLNWRP